MDKRRFIVSCTSIAAASALPACATVAMTFNRKPVSEHPFYRYLKDNDLRFAEKGANQLDIENADFAGESFINGKWHNFNFINCHFPTGYSIQQKETTHCQFNDCDFGPGSDMAILDLGRTANIDFIGCRFINGNVGYGPGKARFIACRFNNTVTKGMNDAYYFIGGDDIEVIDCAIKDFKMSPETRMYMKNCDYKGLGYGISGSLGARGEYITDYIIEDSRIRVAEIILWGGKIKSLTLRGAAVDGTFATQRCEICDSIIMENLKIGTYWIAQTGTKKKIVVKNCSFSEVNKKTTHLLTCAGGYAIDFFMDYVECTNSGGCDLTGAGPALKTKESFRLAETRNQTFTLRNCKIPILYINWLQTYNLLIENCEIGQFDLKQGRIGNIVIRNTKFDMLDLTNTLATNYDIDPTSLASGQIITTGSNFPAGGYPIK
ncbi:MAG: hypothetical protein LBE62_09415 [Azonexus sp.]|jgi:uncharacterized protein YjbI with pentapeptide repeats|nr:hypothetical protein [Azonexus sp.]